MHQLKERMAYLKGLAEGLNVGQGTPEGRVLVGMLDVMSEIVRSLDRLQAQNVELEEYIEAVDDDLTDLENEFFEGLDEDDDEYDEDLEYDVDEDDFEDDTAIEYMEMTCPNCGETVFVDEDVLLNDEIVEVLCPECNETVLATDEVADDESDLEVHSD